MKNLRFFLANILQRISNAILPKSKNADDQTDDDQTEMLRIRAGLIGEREAEVYPYRVVGLRLVVKDAFGGEAAISPIDILGSNGRFRFWKLWKKYGGKPYRYASGEQFDPVAEGSQDKK